jgi:hypothetical protein
VTCVLYDKHPHMWQARSNSLLLRLLLFMVPWCRSTGLAGKLLSCQPHLWAYLAGEALPRAPGSRVCLIALCVASR